jgi:hypothetical protein
MLTVFQPKPNVETLGYYHTSLRDEHEILVALDFQTRRSRSTRRSADLEVGDTAGWETCATNADIRAVGGTGKTRPAFTRARKGP